jgi:hypothetical protein
MELLLHEAGVENGKETHKRPEMGDLLVEKRA